MSAMEQSLRRALEAGDASDPAFRESIYSASERALERMLAAKAADLDAAHAQRVRLAETINRVEEDYFASAAPSSVDASEEGEQPAAPTADGLGEGLAEDERSNETNPFGGPDHAGGRLRDDEGDHRPEAAGSTGQASVSDEGQRPYRDEDRDAGQEGENRWNEPPVAAGGIANVGSMKAGTAKARTAKNRGEPIHAEAEPVPSDWSPGAAKSRVAAASADARRSHRLRPFLFGLGVLLLALVAGLIFFYSTVFAPMEDAAVSAPAISGTVVAATSADPAETEAEWITLFDGTQLEMIATPNGGEVTAVTGPGDRPAVRIAAAAAEGEVDVSIGPGVVNQVKGRTVRVEVTVGSADGQSREFGVRCLFGGDTVCGRQRFTTVQSSEAFVFDMGVPADPAASGTIAIDPGFGAVAKGIDLYSVRLRPVDGA